MEFPLAAFFNDVVFDSALYFEQNGCGNQGDEPNYNRREQAALEYARSCLVCIYNEFPYALNGVPFVLLQIHCGDRVK